MTVTNSYFVTPRDAARRRPSGRRPHEHRNHRNRTQRRRPSDSRAGNHQALLRQTRGRRARRHRPCGRRARSLPVRPARGARRRGSLAGHRHHDDLLRTGRRLRPAQVVGLRRARARAAHPVHAHRDRHRALVQERPRHVLRVLRGRAHLDVHDPRRRHVHRRRATHGARRGLHHQRTSSTSTASEADLSMVEEAVATDDTTVVLTHGASRSTPCSTRSRCSASCPSTPTATDYGAHPIGSGRYMLEQWDRGQQVDPRRPTPTTTARRPRCSAWSSCSWRRTPRSPRRRPARWTWPTPRPRSADRGAGGLRAVRLHLGRLARRVAALRARRRPEGCRRRDLRAGQRRDLRRRGPPAPSTTESTARPAHRPTC